MKTMLTTVCRLKPNNFTKGSIMRALSSTNSVTNNESHQAKKQLFADLKYQERVYAEYKNSQKRIFTIPNILTMSRIAATPAIGYFIWTGAHSQALACFAYAAVTDLFDGFIARKFNQDSDLGAILDPLADKLLLTTCFVALYNVDLMPMWLIKGFIVRDILIVSGGAAVRYYGFVERPSLKKFLDFKNYPTVGFEPTFTSKCNTALQCLLIVLHLSTNHLSGQFVYDWGMTVLHWSAAITTTTSLTQYALRVGQISFMSKFPKSRG